MNNPQKSALKILETIGWSEPSDMSMEDIAWSCGLFVKYKKMDGAQGRILMNDKEAIICVDENISYQPKKNYVIAHEIGHAIMHRHLGVFSDNDHTLSDWYAHGQHELEANAFAAELLMPTDSFSRKVKSKRLNLKLIEDLAGYFGASKTAAFLRYKDLGEYPVMIIFIENGLVKWKTASSDFPFQWLVYSSKVPPYSVAGDYYHKGMTESKPVKVDALEWFPEDFNCLKYGTTTKLWEQCFPSSTNSIVTCLWTA